LGFKEFAKFNDAMLAKQMWRLIHDTNSLFYRVFKSKYFPNDTIFDAKQSSGSFAWKIILKARRVITMVAKWRVCDGRSILVFNLGGRIASSPSVLGSDACVVDLMDQELSWWNSQVINAFFSPSKLRRLRLFL